MAQSFFQGFLQGAATNAAERYDRRTKKEDDLDTQRQLIVMKSQADMDLYKQQAELKKQLQRDNILTTQELIKSQQGGYAGIAQTPDAIQNAAVASTKVNPSMAAPPVNAPVDDNATPFGASPKPTQTASLTPTGNTVSVPEGATMGTYRGINITPEMHSRASMDSLAISMEDPYAGWKAYYDSIEKQYQNTPEYKGAIARVEAEAQGEVALKNAGPIETAKEKAKADVALKKDKEEIEPMRLVADQAREQGAPAPGPEHFLKPKTQRESLYTKEAERMTKWSSGEGDGEGKSLRTAKANMSTIRTLAELQGDVDTGGLIWGSETLNNIRSRFDADADVFGSLTSQFALDKAKEVYPVSNTDMVFLQKLSPSLMGKPEANLAKLQIQAMTSQASIDKNSFFNAYFDKYGTLNGAEKGFDKYMQENPLLDKSSEGLNIIANDNRQSIEEFMSGAKPTSKTPATQAPVSYTPKTNTNIGIGLDLWK